MSRVVAFFRSNGWLLYGTSLLLIVLFLQLFATACGLGTTFDSELNLSIAQAIQSNDTAHDLAIKAPMLPFLLTFMDMQGVRWLFACLLVLSSLLALYMLKNTIEGWFIYFLALPVLFSTVMLMIHSFLWSDALMVTISLGIFVLLFRYLQLPSFKTMGVIALLSTLLIFSRYAGALIVLGILTGLTVLRVERKHLLLYSTVTLLSVALLVGMAPGILSFRWSEINETGAPEILHNMRWLLDALSLWLLPRQIPFPLRLVILLLIVLLIFFQRKSFRPMQILVLCVTGVYFLSLLFIFEIPPSTSEKYLAPLYPLLFIFMIPVLHKAFHQRWRVVFMVVCFLWTSYPITRTIKNAISWNQNQCRVEFLSKSSNAPIWLVRSVFFHASNP